MYEFYQKLYHDMVAIIIKCQFFTIATNFYASAITTEIFQFDRFQIQARVLKIGFRLYIIDIWLEFQLNIWQHWGAPDQDLYYYWEKKYLIERRKQKWYHNCCDVEMLNNCLMNHFDNNESAAMKNVYIEPTFQPDELHKIELIF